MNDYERNADVSKTLTDKWKKGELPSGWHYIKIADIVFIDFFEGKVWKNKKDKYIDEVLAEVPSYELWKAVYEQRNVLLEENTKLKELLKECKHIMSIEKDFASCHFEKDKLCKLLAKIDQVLGEE